MQAFVDFQAVVIPVARVVKGEGEFMVRGIIDVTDVVTTDVPEFDVVVAGDTGCFQKVEVFAEDNVPGVGDSRLQSAIAGF